MHSQLLLNLVDWSFASYRASKTNRPAHRQGVWRCALLKSACPRMPLREKERGIKTERVEGHGQVIMGHLAPLLVFPLQSQPGGGFFFKEQVPVLSCQIKEKGERKEEREWTWEPPFPAVRLPWSLAPLIFSLNSTPYGVQPARLRCVFTGHSKEYNLGPLHWTQFAPKDSYRFYYTLRQVMDTNDLAVHNWMKHKWLAISFSFSLSHSPSTSIIIALYHSSLSPSTYSLSEYKPLDTLQSQAPSMFFVSLPTVLTSSALWFHGSSSLCSGIARMLTRPDGGKPVARRFLVPGHLSSMWPGWPFPFPGSSCSAWRFLRRVSVTQCAQDPYRDIYYFI